MAKRKKRHTQQDHQHSARPPSKSSPADLAKYRTVAITVIAIVLAAIPFSMGKYLEFNTPGAFDSGAYVYSARHIFEGAKLGVDEKTSAQPGTLLVNFIGVSLFGYSETGPMIIQMLLQIIALLAMFFAMRKLFGSIGASVGLIIAAVFLSAPVISKFGNVKEQYMIAFMVISASCFVMRMIGGRALWAILAGAAVVNIYYFKQTGASVIVAMSVCLLARGLFKTRPWRTIRNDVLFTLAGAATGIIPLVAFYMWQNKLGRFLRTLPCSLLLIAIQLVIFFAVIFYAIRFCKQIDIKSKFHKIFHVRRSIWIPGLCLIAVVFIACTVYFHSFIVSGVEFESEEISQQQKAIEELGYIQWYKNLDRDKVKTGGELIWYLKSVPFIKYPLRVINYPLGIIGKAYGKVSYVLSRALGTSGYVGDSRELRSLKKQSEIVFRFYLVLILPVSIAFASLIAAIARAVLRIIGKLKTATLPDQIVILFIVWWLLDMTFVWISPRSYVQYYLPLTASAAMLGGYICFLYSRSLAASVNKIPWRIAGIVAVVCMGFMTVHIFRGFYRSPHHGNINKTRDGVPYKEYGFKQSLDRITESKKGNVAEWEKVADYVKDRTTEDDTIYVWGWYPGIYVKAQRFSSVKKAFESEMNIKSPGALKKEVVWLLRAFKKVPPKFIVDSQKRHFPNHYPPFDLWPATTKGFISNIQQDIEENDRKYAKFLAQHINAEQAERYKALAPFRKFVMDNYTLAEPKQYGKTTNGRIVHRVFGSQRVFRLKANAPVLELK